ncbi:enoyl-CoA hydratase [Roseobacter weihaiensis]|uniref:enoyl-CoA hydratase n=1 Tax=Roseobacter weihaiensis TaxID=2763262 RepID=UPI001D0B5F44|nr:enoyl-CoA hydratase [Roseobacter sp. H9]
MKDTADTPVLLEVDAGVAVVTLNRPQTLNALSEDMLDALQHTWETIGQDRRIKAVILRGAGAHFCAGHNLKEMTARRADADGGAGYFNTLFARCSRMMMSVVHLPQPVIAEVQGIATAAGCQLVATCDLAVAAEDARFATSGVNIGLFCSTPMVALSRNVAHKQAMEMLLLGDFIPAKKAVDIGLINRAVPADTLAQTTQAMARRIVDKSPVAIRIGKEAFYRQAEMGLEEAYAYAGAAMAENMMARDATEGINAFIDKKRMPDWTGD